MSAAVKTAVSLWLVAAISGMMRVCGIQDAVLFNKGILSIGVFALGWMVTSGNYENWKADKRRFLLCFAMASGVVFTEFLGMLMWLEASRGGTNLGPAGVAWVIISTPVMAWAAVPFFYRISGWAVYTDAGRYEKVRLNRIFFMAWGILFVGFLPCALAFYPGLYCYDMVWQWAQFAEGIYSTHHPLIHTLFSGGVIELGKMLTGSYEKGLFIHSLVQLLILSGSMAFALRFLVKRKTRLWVVLTVGAFFLLFPFFPVLGISTTKDTIFGCLFLIVFVCICDMAAEHRFYRGWQLAAFLAAAVLMCLFRNNAVYGLVVMLGVLILTFLVLKFHRKEGTWILHASGMILICIIASQCMFGVLERGLHAAKGSSAEMLSVPMQQMARVYVRHQEELTSEERAEMTRFFDEGMLLKYKYYVSDPVKAGMDMEYFNDHKGDFVRLWMQLGRKFPGEYLASPLYNTFGLWYIGGDSSCYMEYKMSPPFDEEHAVETRSKIPWLMAYYSWFTYENLQEYLPGLSLVFYTSFYSWCIALGAGILVVKRKYIYLILPLFLAAYGFTLFFGPCIIVRYCYGMILCVPVLAVMVFQEEYSVKNSTQ